MTLTPSQIINLSSEELDRAVAEAFEPYPCTFPPLSSDCKMSELGWWKPSGGRTMWLPRFHISTDAGCIEAIRAEGIYIVNAHYNPWLKIYVVKVAVGNTTETFGEGTSVNSLLEATGRAALNARSALLALAGKGDHGT